MPNSLVLRGNPQPGAVDWSRLMENRLNVSLSDTIGLFSRISAADVDPYTIIVGRAVCGKLQWSDDGRKRFEDCLQAAEWLPGFKNVLSFGFGIKHIIRILSSTDEGSICAILCASLAECYTIDMASGILLEMTKSLDAPPDAVPSWQQWRSLVKSCAGLTAKSNFGIRAEHFMHLDGERLVAGQSQTSYWAHSGRGVASRKDIADALVALSQVSRGILQQITITGHADAGFIAAIADWLLSLSVSIHDCSGNLLFRNHDETKKPQLLVIYEREGTDSSKLCTGKVYRLHDATGVIRKEYGLAGNVVLSGRVPWEKALESTFGPDFCKLMSRHPDTLGDALGSAARIYSAVVKAEEVVPAELLLHCTYYFPDSFGNGFICAARTWFPELDKLSEGMTSAAKEPSYKNAIATYETRISQLARACDCVCCSRSSMAAIQDGQLAQWTEFCLVNLTETLIRTIRALSGILIDRTHLRPMRCGLEKMYMLNLRDRASTKPIERILESTGAEMPLSGACRDYF